MKKRSFHPKLHFFSMKDQIMRRVSLHYPQAREHSLLFLFLQCILCQGHAPIFLFNPLLQNVFPRGCRLLSDFMSVCMCCALLTFLSTFLFRSVCVPDLGWVSLRLFRRRHFWENPFFLFFFFETYCSSPNFQFFAVIF